MLKLRAGFIPRESGAFGSALEFEANRSKTLSISN
jgi:hypothetical protein